MEINVSFFKNTLRTSALITISLLGTTCFFFFSFLAQWHQHWKKKQLKSNSCLFLRLWLSRSKGEAEVTLSGRWMKLFSASPFPVHPGARKGWHHFRGPHSRLVELKAGLAAIEAALLPFISGKKQDYCTLAVTGSKGFMFLEHYGASELLKYETALIWVSLSHFYCSVPSQYLK